jgi:hypothetical protein
LDNKRGQQGVHRVGSSGGQGKYNSKGLIRLPLLFRHILQCLMIRYMGRHGIVPKKFYKLLNHKTIPTFFLSRQNISSSFGTVFGKARLQRHVAESIDLFEFYVKFGAFFEIWAYHISKKIK